MTTDVENGTVPVNGLEMYYETHGEGQPLVLLHGAFSAIGTSFGALLPGLAEGRRVVAFELQGYGHTADIDRPLSQGSMAEDVVAAIEHLELGPVDLLGYSMGGFVALLVAIRNPEVVRKLVVMSVGYTLEGVHPGLMDGLGEMTPEMMHGSQFHDEYLRIAPRPEDFDRLFAKKAEMDRRTEDLSADDIRAIAAPTLVMIGDSDLITPEHAVEMFRLRGGGVFGDMPPGMPASQLAVIPGASHVSIASRAEVVVPIVSRFLDAPMPDSE
jgi:pimeloyl-ACP methyl ester carboxylesterase